MVDVIIVLIVVVLMGFALKSSVKHFKGEGACCGGGSGTLDTEMKEKVLDGPAIGKKTMQISGMHCEHCVKAVTEAINKIDGASAKVNLKKNQAVVSYDREIDESILREAVSEAGYKVVSVES